MDNVFASRLKALRTEKELLQKDIAIILGTTDNAIGNYERGTRVPDYDSLNKLADFFNVSVDYLLGRSDIRNNKESGIVTKAFHNLDVDGLPQDAIKQVEEYIELIKLKYNPDGTFKKNT